MTGLKLTTLVAVVLGLSATSLVMAKQPGDQGVKTKDKMERHVSGKGDRDIYAEGKKEKEEQLKRSDEKGHAHDFLAGEDGRHGKHKDEGEKMRDRDEDGGPSGLYKQHDMKMEQEQKELGRGAEQGQEMREQHRRKWWKFWE